MWKPFSSGASRLILQVSRLPRLLSTGDQTSPNDWIVLGPHWVCSTLGKADVKQVAAETQEYSVMCLKEEALIPRETWSWNFRDGFSWENDPCREIRKMNRDWLCQGMIKMLFVTGSGLCTGPEVGKVVAILRNGKTSEVARRRVMCEWRMEREWN